MERHQALAKSYKLYAVENNHVAVTGRRKHLLEQTYNERANSTSIYEMDITDTESTIQCINEEAGNSIENLSFDVFMGYATQTKEFGRTPSAIYLYKDLTGCYQTKYPEAGVKTVVVSYKLSGDSL